MSFTVPGCEGRTMSDMFTANRSNSSSSPKDMPSSSGQSLSDDDIERLAAALITRLQSGSSFRVFEFLLGVFFACAVGWFFYRRRMHRLRHRQSEKDALEVMKHLDDKAIKRLLGDSHMPSWVNLPDYERVGWVNKVLEQLWPSINSSVSAQFREMLGPLLRENKPAWIASLKLFRFDLGDIAPQANGIKVYNQEGETSNQILLEVDFSWVGEQDVQLSIKPIPKHLGPLSPAGALLSSIIKLRAGIERITVNGRARFVWRPLMEELPIIGGMQVALVGMPTFSFDVTLYGGDVSIVPGLEAWLTDFMKETVFRPYILPDKYWMPFCEAANDDALKPEALLLVKVVKAVHVPKMDLFSPSDAYLKMYLRNAMQQRTEVIQNNANPEWNQEFKFMVHEVESQKLNCILMDFDDTNPDDLIGKCELPIRDLEPSKTKEYWLEVDTEADVSDAPASQPKNAGPVDTIIAAEQKVADKGEKLWKKLPGVRQNGNEKCKICLHCTLYMLDSDDVKELLGQSHTSQEGTHAFESDSESPHKTKDDNQADGRRPSFDTSGVRDRDAKAPRDDSQTNGFVQDGSARSADMGDSSSHEDLREDQVGQSKSAGHGHGKDNGREKPVNDSSDDDETFDEAAETDKDGAQDISKDARKAGNAGETSKEQRRPKIEGKTVKRAEEEDLKEKVKDALKGGLLEIRPKRGVDLIRKPWYKASFLRSSAQLEVSVCGQFRRSAGVQGSQPIFNETLNFMLGDEDIRGGKHKTVKMEIWDHKMHLNHFRGGCSLDLQHILRAKRVSKSMKLSGVKRGELAFEIVWIPAHEAAGPGARTR